MDQPDMTGVGVVGAAFPAPPLLPEFCEFPPTCDAAFSNHCQLFAAQFHVQTLAEAQAGKPQADHVLVVTVIQSATLCPVQTVTYSACG